MPFKDLDHFFECVYEGRCVDEVNECVMFCPRIKTMHKEDYYPQIFVMSFDGSMAARFYHQKSYRGFIGKYTAEIAYMNHTDKSFKKYEFTHTHTSDKYIDPERIDYEYLTRVQNRIELFLYVFIMFYDLVLTKNEVFKFYTSPISRRSFVTYLPRQQRNIRDLIAISLLRDEYDIIEDWIHTDRFTYHLNGLQMEYFENIVTLKTTLHGETHELELSKSKIYQRELELMNKCVKEHMTNTPETRYRILIEKEVEFRIDHMDQTNDECCYATRVIKSDTEETWYDTTLLRLGLLKVIHYDKDIDAYITDVCDFDVDSPVQRTRVNEKNICELDFDAKSKEVNHIDLKLAMLTSLWRLIHRLNITDKVLKNTLAAWTRKTFEYCFHNNVRWMAYLQYKVNDIIEFTHGDTKLVYSSHENTVCVKLPNEESVIIKCPKIDSVRNNTEKEILRETSYDKVRALDAKGNDHIGVIQPKKTLWEKFKCIYNACCSILGL